MAQIDGNDSNKIIYILLLAILAISVFSLMSSLNANKQAKDAQEKLRTHHHSSTTSGTEVKENDTPGPDYLMDGTNSPSPTQ